MSAPRETNTVKLVGIQSNESLTNTLESTFTPSGVTCFREAKGRRCRASTQVNVLSPEITSMSDADSVHKVGRQNSQFQNGEKLRDRRGLRQLHGIKKTVCGTWENQYIPVRVCNYKPENGEDLQEIYWWSDKFIVAEKFRNGNGAKGLTRKPLIGDSIAGHRAGLQLLIEPKSMTYSTEGREVFLKSRVRENCKHGSVMGFMVFTERRWL